MPPYVQSRDPNTHPAAALGAQLRAVREAHEFGSQGALAALLGTDRSVVTKAETGERPPQEAVMNTWLDLCEVTGLHRAALVAMWRVAHARHDPGRQRTAPWFETETKSHTLRYWAPILVPGIAQIEGYARALYVAMGFSDDEVEEMVRARMARQSILTRPDPPDVTIVVWEPVLYHLIGSAQVMCDQLDRLIELSRGPVRIHVLPGELGANVGLGGAINLAATDDGPELLLADALIESRLTGDTSLVRRASATFNDVRADSRPRAGSRTSMMEAMEIWKTRLGGSPPSAASLGPLTA